MNGQLATEALTYLWSVMADLVDWPEVVNWADGWIERLEPQDIPYVLIELSSTYDSHEGQKLLRELAEGADGETAFLTFARRAKEQGFSDYHFHWSLDGFNFPESVQPLLQAFRDEIAAYFAGRHKHDTDSWDTLRPMTRSHIASWAVPPPRPANTEVKFQPLGASRPVVSRLGLGLAALGRPGYINLGHGSDVGEQKDVEAMRKRAWTVLDAAWAAGVRYFDTARSYGEAEAFLGDWLRERGYSTAIGSKWGYTYTAGWRTDARQHEVKDQTPATLERQWPETLSALGRAPDVYLIHSATLESAVLEDGRVLARLAELAASGVRVGLSTSGPGQADTLRRALAVRVDGVNPLSVVQATWNLLEPSAGEALAEAHAAGWGVVVKEGVANGRLTSRGDRLPVLAEVCADLEATPDAVALAAVLAQPWADVVLSGATTAEQLHSNLAALRTRLTPAHLGALRDLAQPAADYWRERSALPWT